MKWNEISKDPNDPSLRRRRSLHLRSLRSDRPIKNRVEFLVEKCRGKIVLDVGVVEHFSEASGSETWLHAKICDVAKSCIGVDILEGEIEKLKHKGYNLFCHNFEEKKLDKKFDIIILGDVLEHLNNPGSFISNLSSCLVEGGEIFVSVPNPWYFSFFLKTLWHTNHFEISTDHTAWYDKHTIYEIFSRYDIELIETIGVLVSKGYSVQAKLLIKIIPVLIKIGFNYEIFSRTIIYRLTNRRING